MKTFELAPDGESIRCLQCGQTSYNATDVRMRFCGHCRMFHEMTRCDFCMLADVPLPHEYQAQSHITAHFEKLDYVDCGVWCACVTCGALIAAQQWQPLLRRGLDGLLRDHPEIPDTPYTRAALTGRIRELLKAVFGHEVAA